MRSKAAPWIRLQMHGKFARHATEDAGRDAHAGCQGTIEEEDIISHNFCITGFRSLALLLSFSFRSAAPTWHFLGAWGCQSGGLDVLG